MNRGILMKLVAIYH